MPSLNILIEGNADYVLLNMLRVHPKQLNEKGMGKERIIEKVKKHGQRKFSDIYVGLVDADKPNTDISSEYLEFKEVKSNNGITLFKKDSNQYLIELCCPALEKWLLNSAESVTINLADYNLPNDVKELKDKTRRFTIRKDDSFKNFIRELNSRNAPAFVYLNELLNELFEQAGVTRY